MTGVALSPVRKALRRPWYWFWRFVERRLYDGRAYTLQVPYGHRVYTPWFEPDSEFAQAIKAVRNSGRLLVSPDRCYVLYTMAKRAAFRGCAMAKCGVYVGGSAQLIASAVDAQSAPVPIHLYDTFSGMPGSSVPDRDYHSSGDFADTSLGAVKQRLAGFSFCCFHAGFIPDTFRETTEVNEFSFVHIDVDIYRSTLDCLEWFWPRLCSGGVIIVDDYGFYPYRSAARAAVDEFFARCIDKPLALPTGQALVIKQGA